MDSQDSCVLGAECELLDGLPSEILLHICSFLDASTIWHSLSKVSQVLHDLLVSDKFWKIRIGKRWPQKYPAIPGKFSIAIDCLMVFYFER
jgi:hypothetical protein